MFQNSVNFVVNLNYAVMTRMSGPGHGQERTTRISYFFQRLCGHRLHCFVYSGSYGPPTVSHSDPLNWMQSLIPYSPSLSPSHGPGPVQVAILCSESKSESSPSSYPPSESESRSSPSPALSAPAPCVVQAILGKTYCIHSRLTAPVFHAYSTHISPLSHPLSYLLS
jgi:hypothetical protein